VQLHQPAQQLLLYQQQVQHWPLLRLLQHLMTHLCCCLQPRPHPALDWAPLLLLSDEVALLVSPELRLPGRVMQSPVHLNCSQLLASWVFLPLCVPLLSPLPQVLEDALC
jgi:hypothetical protein